MGPGRDRIVLSGVRAVGRHGVLSQERQDGQEFLVDVDMQLDLRRAGESDDLRDTVSYADVADDVVRRIAGEPHDLIETLAARIADDVLARDLVESVEVVVHKPHAPIRHEFRDVEVHIRRVRETPAVIALGANLGDSRATLEAAVGDLARIPGVRVESVSPLYETEPVGGPDQPAYLNAVVLATVSRTARSLLQELQSIEARHGRRRDVRWGPRTLDLDLIQMGIPGEPSEVVSGQDALRLPHPRAHERAFVLQPWLVADPRALLRTPTGVHPVSDLLESVDTSGVRAHGKEWNPTW